MKYNNSLHLISNDNYSVESLTQLVNTMEQLEATKENIINHANSAFVERSNRLGTIKSRINRANQIIQTFLGLNKALTIKSKLINPQQEHHYYHLLKENDVTSVYSQRINNPLINANPMNDPALLGKEPKAMIERISTVSLLQKVIPMYNDLANDLNLICPEISLANIDEMGGIDPLLDFVTSDFDFYKKIKIEEIKKMNFGILMSQRERESKAVAEFMNTSTKDIKKKKEKPIIDHAPTGLKERIPTYNVNRNLLEQGNNVIQVNLNENLTGLGGVSQIGGVDNTVDDYEKIKPDQMKRSTVFEEDIEENNIENEYDIFNMPVDMIRTKNNDAIQKLQNAAASKPTTTSQPTNPIQNTSSTTSNTPSVPAPVQPPSGSVPVPPPLMANPPKVVAPPQQPQTPTTPVQVVSAPIGGSVPLPPPLIVAKVDPELLKKRQEDAKKNLLQRNHLKRDH